MAIMMYLEEFYPEPALMPKEKVAKAQVIALKTAVPGEILFDLHSVFKGEIKMYVLDMGNGCNAGSSAILWGTQHEPEAHRCRTASGK